MICSTCRTVSSDWLSIAGGVSPPICGVAMTFGSFASSGVGIWSSARPTSIAAPAMRFSRNAADKRRLVDEIAARQVDEERMRLHARQRRLPDQVFGLLVGDREADHKVGTAKQIVERHMLDAGVADGRKGIGDQNLHAQHLGDISEVAADAAIADDAEAAAGQLPAHDDVRLALRHGSRPSRVKRRATDRP